MDRLDWLIVVMSVACGFLLWTEERLKRKRLRVKPVQFLSFVFIGVTVALISWPLLRSEARLAGFAGMGLSLFNLMAAGEIALFTPIAKWYRSYRRIQQEKREVALQQQAISYFEDLPSEAKNAIMHRAHIWKIASNIPRHVQGRALAYKFIREEILTK